MTVLPKAVGDEEVAETLLQAELHRQLRQQTYWIMTSLWAAVGVAVGVSQVL